MNEYAQRKASLGFLWIKSRRTGKTYLCPSAAVSNRHEVSEEELDQFGIDESDNPQND